MEFSIVSTPSSLEWPFPILRSEQDRDLLDLGEHLLIVATDRLSAHGEPLREIVPLKGHLLSRLARFWFRATRDVVPNPMVSLAMESLPETLKPYWPSLAERSTLLRRIRHCAVKCAIHGCLTGAAFEEYEAHGSVGSTKLPPKLRKGTRLPSPLFAPFIEDEHGQPRVLSMSEMADLVGIKAVHQLRDRSLALFLRGYRYAWEREIILADARFSFGWMPDGTLVLADEALTPSTSRYWSIHTWRPDAEPLRMDQHELLDYLDTDRRWNGKSPVPHLPDHVVEAVQTSYRNLVRRFGITT